MELYAIRYIYVLIRRSTKKKAAGKKPGKEKLLMEVAKKKEGEPEQKKPQTKSEQLFNSLSLRSAVL